MNTTSKKIFSWKTVILISLGVGLLSAGLSVFLQTRGGTVYDFLGGGLKPITGSLPGGLGFSFQEPAEPIRLSIPIIGVDAAIQSVGLSKTGNGTMGIPSNFTDVAWYNGGVRPGTPGSAVIAGHLDGIKVPQAVFYNLKNLKPDDLVEVIDKEGRIFKFMVVEIKTYDYNAPAGDIFSGDSTKARLNLITCGGNWIKSKKLYDKRIVVFTELVEVEERS
ncbi:MAG: class F sortase [Patescibacteria group bacterium]